MLYIFQVDTGQMLCFEMDVAISTVHTLKSKIATTHGIPMDKQVLLVSGGEILEPNSRVCNYAAGTDTNPIFLFNRLNIEGGGVVVPDVSGVSDSADGTSVQMADLDTLQKQIDSSTTLPPTYTSVVARAQLAQHIYEMGKELTKRCETLTHHQHLQHQGWAAVIANLDDIVGLFNSKLNSFVTAYETFTGACDNNKINLITEGLDTTLKTLSQLTIPNYVRSATTQSISNWLSEHYVSTSLQTHLNSTATNVRKTYDHVTCENFLTSLSSDCATVTDKASSTNMKEIKGLEERLYGLDQLLQEANNLVLDQYELTQAFHQNASRASDLRDSSIYQDLSASHHHQLLVMFSNHRQLDDIKRRCGRAKEELTSNLNTRLKWVAFVQKNLSEMGGKIAVYHESLKRLRRDVNILTQIHNCEVVFKSYVHEVNTRASVSSKLARLLCNVHEFNRVVEAENTRRESFRNTHGGHFLSQAFDILMADKSVDKLLVPVVVEYTGECVDVDEFDTCDAEKVELKSRVKELEEELSNLRTRVGELASEVSDRERKVAECSVGNEGLRNQIHGIASERDSEKMKSERLSCQISELKALIDEFRVKEDDNIRIRDMETAQYNNKIRDIEAEKTQQMVELQRMLEFDHAQAVKALEEKHKMEMVALVKRFKMVNDCTSNQKLRSSESTTPVQSPTRPRVSESDTQTSNTLSEDEEYESRRRTDSLRFEDDTERAQDATSLLDDQVPDRIVLTANKLTKLSKISITSCRVGGQSNLFYYEPKYNAYVVYLSNRNVHFLNTSGAESEDVNAKLRNVDKSTVLFTCNITDKEFCVARRPQNRYNVPQGFHFTRVRVCVKSLEFIHE